MIRLWLYVAAVVIVGGTMTRRDDEDGLCKALGQRAAEVRKARGWTQERLAEDLGVAAVTVSRWETGHRGMSVTTLARMADVLGVSLSDLLDVQRAVPEPQRDVQEGELLVSWYALDERDRARVLEFTKVMART